MLKNGDSGILNTAFSLAREARLESQNVFGEKVKVILDAVSRAAISIHCVLGFWGCSNIARNLFSEDSMLL